MIFKTYIYILITSRIPQDDSTNQWYDCYDEPYDPSDFSKYYCTNIMRTKLESGQHPLHTKLWLFEFHIDTCPSSIFSHKLASWGWWDWDDVTITWDMRFHSSFIFLTTTMIIITSSCFFVALTYPTFSSSFQLNVINNSSALTYVIRIKG